MNVEVKVWDWVVRSFHWSLVLGFVVAYLSGESWEGLHVWAGYFILGLLLVRMVWGVTGTHYARFSSFMFSPKTVVHYLKGLRKLQARRYLGHSPAGAMMVFLLLFLLFATSFSGLAYYAAEDQAGPLVSLFAGMSENRLEMLEEIHEWLANLTVLAVVLHIAGVIFSSFLHNENLPRAMVTGMKKQGERESE